MHVWRICRWQPFDRQRAGGTRCNGCRHEGGGALHAAQRSRAYEGSALLLARDADVHAVDAAARTTLHIAAQEARSSQDPRVLCAYGADPARRDRSGKVAADLGPASSPAGFSLGGGCAQIAARARPGAPVPMEEADAAWAAYMCSRVAEGAPDGCQK